MRSSPQIAVLALVVAAATAADAAAAQRQRWPGAGDQGEGQAAPQAAVPRNEPAPPASAARPPSGARARLGAAPEGDGDQRQAVPRGSRPRGDPPRTGTAVPRPAGQPPARAGRVYTPPGYRGYSYPRLYYPYGYGTFGLGYFYYDPYTWYPAGPYGWRFSSYGYPTGELRIQVKPREAEVYVDGYWAGLVDDFDGVFQSLRLEEGPYKIEIVAPGYETLEFNVRIQPGRKITYRGELKPRP